MEFPERLYCLSTWNRMYGSLVLVFVGILAVEVTAWSKNCPVSAGTLHADPADKSYEFFYDFKPIIQTNIDLIDNLLTSDKEVRCEWQVKARKDHTAMVKIEDFQLIPAEGNKHGDCLRIYDGKTSESPELGHLCGGDLTKEDTSTFKAKEDYLLIVYMQGEITGPRRFQMEYRAVPPSKEMILKIAGIVSGTVAAVAVVILAFKFTRNCRPCRKRCCPDQEIEQGTTERELRPLSPAVTATTTATATTTSVVSPGARNGSGSGGGGADGRSPSAPVAVSAAVANETRNVSRNAQERGGGGRENEEEEEDEFSLPVDEPPPSYDSIFGSDDERNK